MTYRLADLDGLLQTLLEQVYRVDRAAEVGDFRIDAEGLSAVLGADARGHREALVVAHRGDETLLALFIADHVLHQARAFVHAVNVRGEVRNLDAFCAAAEGVSHFVYFTFCGAQQERPVSRVELELQAEIDKFLVLRLGFSLGGPPLLEALFDHFRLDARLAPDETARYRLAHQAGRRYARWLEARFARGDGAHALRDARRLYRKPLAEKLAHISGRRVG